MHDHSSSLAARLTACLASIGKELESQPPEAELESALRDMLDRGRRAWPDIAVPDEAFVALVADKVADTSSLLPALAALDADEMYLACGCDCNAPNAVARFEATYSPTIKTTLARMQLSDEMVADVMQSLLERLLLSRSGKRALICKYAGQGSLQGLIRVSAYRAAITLLRQDKSKSIPLEDDYQLALVTTSPELAAMRAEYRIEFQRAFADAFQVLSSRERNILRLRFIDSLSVDQISALYRVHRTTASRWLSSARKSVAKETKRLLRQRLQVGESQLGPLIALVQSHLDLSIEHILRTRDRSR